MMPESWLETIWRLRFRIGLILAICAMVAGLISTLQFTGSDVAMKAVANPPPELTEPREIAEVFLNKETTKAERLALLREPYDVPRVQEYFENLALDAESEIHFMRPNGQFQILDVN
jgi:hypothetical protein